MIAPGDMGRMNTQLMTASLGYEMKSRGTDATGIYTCDAKGRWKVRKQANPADVFLAYRYGIGQNAKSLLLHTRMATQGKPNRSGNNHPIRYGNIVGIHNGVVYNDNALFRENKWERIAEVDSEAIFAALDHLPQTEALESIDGSWAIAWVRTDEDPRGLWLCRGSQSPLHYALTKEGSLVFASTADAVKEAFEFGGVKGVPEVTAAPEGFLGYVNPDGGLEIKEAPDTSGKKAIGARYVTRNGGGWQGHGYYGGMSWEQEDAAYNEAWQAKQTSDEPTIGVRYMVKGEKGKPEVGDVRRHIDGNGKWHYERCVWVGKTGASSWTIVDAWEPKADEPKQIEAPKEVVLPFDDRDEAEDFMLGYAEVGDFVTFDKGAVDGGSGYFGGYVKAVDAEGRVFVELRSCWFEKSAAYMISCKNVNGKELHEVST